MDENVSDVVRVIQEIIVFILERVSELINTPKE